MKPVDIGTVAEILNRVGETQTAVAGMREDIKALRARRDQEQRSVQKAPVITPPQEEMDADDEGDGPPPPPPRVRRWKVPRRRNAGLNEFHVCPFLLTLIAYHNLTLAVLEKYSKLFWRPHGSLVA